MLYVQPVSHNYPIFVSTVILTSIPITCFIDYTTKHLVQILYLLSWVEVKVPLVLNVLLIRTVAFWYKRRTNITI